MPFELTIEEIGKLCGARPYQRGLRYQREGRVLVAEWDEDSQAIYGEVEGRSHYPYEQEIYFTPAKRNRIKGFCSCPVGTNCKHVAAVLLEWIELNLTTFVQRSDQQISVLHDWQQNTIQRLQTAEEAFFPEPGQVCLLHLLQLPLHGRGPTGIEIKTVKSRLLKRGGWGKCSHFNLDDLNGYSYYHYGASSAALPVDREIAKLLVAPDSYSHALPQLDGDVGLLVLHRLLKSGRCFFQTPDNSPLDFGPERKASFSWMTEGSETRLEIKLDDGPSRWLLIPTSPPWYLDTENHQCGPIVQPFSTELLQSLSLLPPVAEDQLTELSYFLLQRLPHESIPLPVELQINDLDQPPVPHLLLHSVCGPTGSRHHLVRLRFDYGPLSLSPQLLNGLESELLRQNDQDWHVKRYPQVELAALQALRENNLIPAEQSLATSAELDLLFAVKSLSESALAWKDFLAGLPQLEADGWRVEIDPSFVISFETTNSLQADIDETSADWFELALCIEHDGHRIELLPLLLQWLEEHEETGQPLMHRLEGNRWLEIPSSVLEPVLETLVELFQDPQLETAGHIKLPRSLVHSLTEIESRLEDSGHQLDWRGGERLRHLAEKLKNFQGIAAVAAPAGLTAELRCYQQQGLAWLQFLREYRFNGVLADDMGLGKTIQTLSHLLLEKEAGRLDHPALIVAPTSVLSNWQREAERFTPGLKCLILHGPQRVEHFQQLSGYDLIVTSYALLNRDLSLHQEQNYHSLILDEAQAIKNPRAKTALAAREIKASHRLCLTGTPLENHLGELWSLFHFLMPGFLSNQKRFTQLFRTPIEKHQDKMRQQQLQQRLAPFVLRRTKEQVARELPPKTLMVREAELGGPQARLYESLRLAMTKKISNLLERKGVQKSHIEILDALLKLRQACCDPRLVRLESARKVKQSAKLEVLLELLEKLLSEGRKILIFSQFTSMLSLIETELQARSIEYSKLTGQTRKRDAVISAFQDGLVPVFLISLKAGGVGLNLTAADTVIHYDPWWNPAAENQATDRAHRIGQVKPVFVYKLIASGTVEEKILQLQEKKQKLADGVYRQEKTQEPLTGINVEELLSLLSPIEQ